MSNAVIVYQDADAVRKDITALRSQVEDILPSRIDPDRFLRVVAKTVIENPKLMACTRLSLLSSIHTAAQLGLEPTGLLGSAYLVPYRRRAEVDGKWQSIMEAQLIPGYRGLIDLARRSGEIDAIEARVVRLRDHFDYRLGTDPLVDHRPFVPNPADDLGDRDPGPFVAAYMVATLKGGYKQAEVMSYDEVEAVRKRSKAADDGPWVTDWSEMARKTVVRRGAKYLPLTTDFRTALELDELAERGAESPTMSTPPSRAAQLLLDRATARVTALDGQQTPEPIDDSASTENGAPDASSSPVPDEMPEPPIEARAICGATNDELGVCTRMPDHTAGHRSEAGAWPRGAK